MKIINEVLSGLGIVCFGIAIGILIGRTDKTNYKQGQIDALTGNIKYELVINDDSTKTWEEINNDK